MSPPMSVEEAKARLLALAAERRPAPARPWPSTTIPAAIGALLLGLLAARRRRGIGLLGLGAIVAHPVVRSIALSLVSAGARRLIKTRRA